MKITGHTFKKIAAKAFQNENDSPLIKNMSSRFWWDSNVYSKEISPGGLEKHPPSCCWLTLPLVPQALGWICHLSQIPGSPRANNSICWTFSNQIKIEIYLKQKLRSYRFLCTVNLLWSLEAPLPIDYFTYGFSIYRRSSNPPSL